MKNKFLLSMLGMATALCVGGGSLQAQDDTAGGPPPGQVGGGGPGDAGGNGGPGGPPPGNFGNGGPGGPGGNFDPAKFEQRMLEQTRKSLNFTNDDEWAVIQPLVQKVMEARREAGPGGPGGFGRAASSEQQALQKALDDAAPIPQVKETLAKYRAARAEKRAALATAQASLLAVLSVKQEAEAVLLGLVP